MATLYKLSDYDLSIPQDFDQLLVTRKSDGVVTPHDLNDGWTVTVSNESYVLTEGTLSESAHTRDFNPDEDLDLSLVPNPFRFEKVDTMNGWIGSSDIRDIGRITEYHYDLDQCEVSFQFFGADRFQVKCFCKGECDGPESCFTKEIRDLN